MKTLPIQCFPNLTARFGFVRRVIRPMALPAMLHACVKALDDLAAFLGVSSGTAALMLAGILALAGLGGYWLQKGWRARGPCRKRMSPQK